MKRWWFFIFLMFFFTNIQLLYAEEKESRLEEIVVTATRTEKDIESVPGSVAVITKDDIEKRNIKSVDNALNTIAGVYNKSGKSFMETTSSISLRGIPDDKRTLFLLDGIAINDAYSGSVSYQLLSVEDIERIEVVKGPFSSLYGGYAMGGVVNVITKMSEKREFTLKTGYGSSWNRGEGLDDLRKVYLSYGDKFKDKFSLFASYGYRATNGYPTDFNVQSSKPTTGITGWSYTTDNKGNTRYLIGDKGDNRWWDDQLTLKARYDFTKETKLNLSFMRSRYEYNYDDPHTYLRNATGDPVWAYGTVRESSFLSGAGGRLQNTYNIGFETVFSSGKVKLSLGIMDREKSWYVTRGTTATRTGGPGTLSETPSQSYNADIQFTVPAFDRHILTFGGAFRHGWADTKEHNLTNWKDEDSKTTLSYQSKGKDRTYAIFVQDEIMILDNLTAYIGFRQDWWETYDGYANDVGKAGYPKKYTKRRASSFSPKAAIVYKPLEKTTLRTSIGKAFRPPTVYELYRTWTSSSGITYAGNPDLKPEMTTSWDLGIEQGLWKGAKIGITYFENYMKDLIYRKTVTSTYQELINAGKAESKGVEIDAEQRFDKWLRIFANFTYTDGKIKENIAKPSTVGKRLIQVPQRMFNLGAELEKGPLSTSFTGRYISKRFGNDDNSDTVNGVYTSYDPYFTADVKVSYKIMRNAAVSFSVDNIFDRDYWGYYKAPGRSWFADFTLRF
ncbi:TonB-dependent receptor [Dissulfurispira thermophila]|uniref:TonB-dependent receptor n=1 Tax=Dissulfurispira thermophila TaxID=2715679 RepID=A0A7G1GZV9_9BACT|nr:TonB-dependent receptor [Dissulfurispira thermophila]BCB95944.1 TonB-dependent receptor [Dissulfurispira thermophila]